MSDEDYRIDVPMTGRQAIISAARGRISEADCPIGCGMCCGCWREILPNETSDDGNCPHLTELGCDMPRADRPVSCNYYVCAALFAYMCGELPLEDARYLTSLKAQNSMAKWEDLLSKRGQ